MHDEQQYERQRTALMRGLFPVLARDLDAVFDAPRHGGPGETGAAADFETQLGAEVHQFQQRHAALAWHSVTDTGARTQVLDAFKAAREALRGSSIELPAPESFAALVSFDRVTELLGADAEAGAGMAVVPAPHGLGIEGWRDLFRLVAQRQPHRLNPSEPLIVSSEAEREFERLDGVCAVGAEGLTAVAGTAGPDSGVQWSLRLVPAAPAPALLGLNFEHGPHVTLPEMLMLQLMRITTGDEPLDQASFTWIAGELAAGKLAARHVYDVADRAVRVSCREIGNQGPHLGARTPVALV
ncbi:hypothetical protein ACXR2T_11930 [Leucobacter sp. HY1910]